MIGRSVIVKRGGKSEAEKPFWISYADLMTALMVLFLVAMSVAMMAVTSSVSDVERQKHELEESNVQAEERNRKLRLALEQREADKKQLEADKEALKRNEQALKDYEAKIEAANIELKKNEKTPEQIAEEKAKKERENDITALLNEVESAASGSSLTFESLEGFPAGSRRASLRDANRHFSFRDGLRSRSASRSR